MAMKKMTRMMAMGRKRKAARRFKCQTGRLEGGHALHLLFARWK